MGAIGLLYQSQFCEDIMFGYLVAMRLVIFSQCSNPRGSVTYMKKTMTTALTRERAPDLIYSTVLAATVLILYTVLY